MTDRIWTPADLTASAVDVADLRSHLRIDNTDEYALITAYGLAATAMVERYTQRLMVRRSCVLSLSDLPTGQTPIPLSDGVVGAITSVVVDGVAVTGCTALGASPAMLIPAADWPTVTGEGYPVVITYTAGFTAPPADLAAAVMLIVGDLFQNRSNSSEASMSEVPISAKALMQPHRIMPR